ncbi:MAG: triose-phosphate isomerase [Patescibacteria group bacterium]
MKSIVVANWKMNPATFKEAKKLFEATRKAAESAKNVAIVVAPPAIFLRELSVGYKGKRLSFAVQNAHYEAGGAFTGEVSMSEARDAKCSSVIIGHAERRGMGESNEDTRKKVAVALAIGLTPVLCVGERTRSQSGEHFEFVREQLVAGFADVPPAKIPRVVIAYEPVWAIGAERPMNARDMHEMAIFIRKTIVDRYGQGGMNLKILYGGSIDESNAGEMMRNGDVNGLLVGRVSTDAAKFTALVSVLDAL